MTASVESEPAPGQVTGLSIQQENQTGELQRQQHNLLLDGIQVLVPSESSRIHEFPSLLMRCMLDDPQKVQLLSVP